MNFRKQAVSLLAMAGMVVGMTGGIVSAQTASDNTNLQVTCNVTPSVAVNVVSDLVLDITAYDEDGYDSLKSNANLEIDMNLGCTFSDDFSVKAEIGTFRNSTNSNLAFSGSHLRADGGVQTGYTGPNADLFGYGIVGPAKVNPVIFNGSSTTGTPIENDTDSFWIFTWDVYSSGMTSGAWDMQLVSLPDWLYAVPGTYVAPLTVELSVE